LPRAGKLRVAINHGNAVRAKREAAGNLSGVSVDIPCELGRRLALPLTLVAAFDAAGKVSAAASKDVWDVAFLARDPERAREIAFTAPYIVINGTFVVRPDSSLDTPEQVDWRATARRMPRSRHPPDAGYLRST
jgi:polar amino acid transport system substrate-binding protein